MNKSPLILGILLPLLTACSTLTTQPATSDIKAVTPKLPIDPLIQQELLGTSGLSKLKMGQTLQLVRVMEGGACKNGQQGVFGLFKLYANLDDIERIKQAQGPEVFADFELSIQDFSMHALQQAVNRFDFKIAANSPNKKHSQAQQVKSFSMLFTDLVSKDIKAFEAKTTLTLDVIPDIDALLIYTDGCEIPHAH